FSHLLGASVGREGAALQMGGSVGEYMGAGFRLSKDDKKTMIMAGMSAAFSAVFGTPIAASVFSIEVVTVGLMHYEALLPSVIASFTARFVAAKLGANALSYELNVEPDFTPLGMLKVAGLSLLCGLISIVFCMAMHKGEEISKKGIPNDYIRSVIFGTSILVLSLIFNDQVYNGTGTEYIHLCLNGDTRSLGFLIKMVFTVLSILAGYKGGEIVPSFFMGASLGSLYGNLLGFSPELCAALGLSGMFCSVTNCPITSFLIFCELFGFDNAPYAMLTCALCYILSGYYGLYTGQDILYSKFRSSYINKKTK
nr:chloride channel protein [Lachnospiraceae bacterium]